MALRNRAGLRRVALLILLCGLTAAAVMQQRMASRPERKLYASGVAAGDRHDLPAATVDFEKAIAANPRFGDAYELLAACYLADHKVARALDMLDRLRTVEPHRPHLSTRIAEAYVSVDNVYTVRWAREAVLEEPRSPRARLVLALGLVRSGDPLDAIAEINIVSRLHGRSAVPERDFSHMTQADLMQYIGSRIPYASY